MSYFYSALASTTGQIKIVSLIGLFCITPITFAAQSTLSAAPEDEIHPHYYHSDVSTVFEKTVETLKALKWKIKSADLQAGVVLAKTPVSMRTWGDKVKVLVYQIDDGRVRVDITSRSPYQITGWGKNKENVLRFYGHLDQLMGESTALTQRGGVKSSQAAPGVSPDWRERYTRIVAKADDTVSTGSSAGDALRALFADNTSTSTTSSSKSGWMYTRSDNTTLGRLSNGDMDEGTWHISKEGWFCRTWKRWADGKEGCWQVEAEKNNKYKLTPKAGVADPYVIKILQGHDALQYRRNH